MRENSLVRPAARAHFGVICSCVAKQIGGVPPHPPLAFAGRIVMQGSARIHRGPAHLPVRAVLLGCGAAAVLLLAALLLAARRSTPVPPGEASLVPARFAREVGRYRLTVPRFSVSRHHAPCPAHLPSGGTIPRAACSVPPPEAAARALHAAVARRGTAAVDPARYATALADVLWADGGGVSADRAIGFLESAARVADRPAAVLADLSGAYLVRGELRQDPEDLFRALDAAGRAAQLDPGNPVACFNRALALEYAGADRRAAEAWERCARIDGASGWGREARRRAEARATAAADTAAAPDPSPTWFPARLEAFVAAEPGAARVFGWEKALAAWGQAVLRGDSAAARGHLSLAEGIGAALARRGGDRTLEDAVVAIRAVADDGARRRLARAHVEYAEGVRIYNRVDRIGAAPFVRRILALRPPSAPLLAWTRRLDGMVRLARGEFRGAGTRLTAAAAKTDTLRHPALAASFHATRGTALLRNGGLEQAREAWSVARRLLERAGERENAAGTRCLEADAEFILGVPEGHATMHRALTALREFRRSVWLHNALAVLAIELADEGLPYAALELYDEGVGMARAIGDSIYEVEARLYRAQLLAAMGRRQEARADVAAAEPVVLRLADGERRTWFQADLHAARAVLLLRDDPRRAAAELDSLLSASGGARTELRVLLGLLGRAQARMAAGDAGGATADLDSATRLLAERRNFVTTPLLRTSILDAARETFDGLVMLRLARGDTLGALRALERGRFSVGPARATGGDPEGWTLPPGTAALDYALIGDTLLAWAVTPAGAVLHRRTVGRAALVRAVERLRTALELRAPDAELRPLLTALYGDLVRPLRGALPPGARVAVVADGELADVPFAALFDPDAGRYLVDVWTFVTASSLRDIRPAPVRAADGPALFVSDPAFDRRAHPGLSRLSGAAAEIVAVAPIYSDTLLLGGADADPAAVVSRLPRAGVFHFAGHAVFDDERPARSFLLLAPGPDDPGGGRLTAAELGGLDLRGVDLVVLSSCETLRSPGRRSGGFAGLAGALLSAGVDGVVGSPWRVEDGLSRGLMTDFHQGYRRGGDGPGALRDAQRRALYGGDPAMRSPAVWAAFRYAGN